MPTWRFFQIFLIIVPRTNSPLSYMPMPLAPRNKKYAPLPLQWPPFRERILARAIGTERGMVCVVLFFAPDTEWTFQLLLSLGAHHLLCVRCAKKLMLASGPRVLNSTPYSCCSRLAHPMLAILPSFVLCRVVFSGVPRINTVIVGAVHALCENALFANQIGCPIFDVVVQLPQQKKNLQTVWFHRQLCKIIPALQTHCLRLYTTVPPSSQRGDIRLWAHSVMLCDAFPRGHSCLTAGNGVQWFTGCYSLGFLEAPQVPPHLVLCP